MRCLWGEEEMVLTFGLQGCPQQDCKFSFLHVHCLNQVTIWLPGMDEQPQIITGAWLLVGPKMPYP